MLVRAARTCSRLVLARPLHRAMSLPAEKRAHSPTPPPPRSSARDPAAPAAAQAAAADPQTKRVKLTVEDPVSVPPVLVEEPLPSTSTSTSQPSKANKAKQPRKARARKVKPPKPGGVEEAGAFDVLELLGQERVDELVRLQDDEGRDWVAEAEREWGKGAEGEDVEVRVLALNDHGACVPRAASGRGN